MQNPRSENQREGDETLIFSCQSHHRHGRMKCCLDWRDPRVDRARNQMTSMLHVACAAMIDAATRVRNRMSTSPPPHVQTAPMIVNSTGSKRPARHACTYCEPQWNLLFSSDLWVHVHQFITPAGPTQQQVKRRGDKGIYEGRCYCFAWFLSLRREVGGLRSNGVWDGWPGIYGHPGRY
jgi:hypothetical protein